MLHGLVWIFLICAIVVAALVGIALAQFFELFLLRRWTARVTLPDPVAYTESPSFSSNSAFPLHLHSNQPARITFHRCGPAGFTKIHETQAPRCTQSNEMHRWTGFNWPPSIILPANSLPAGLYRVDVEHHNDASKKWCLPLVLSNPRPSPVVVVSSTNTWNAYNDFGGLSNYDDAATPIPLKLLRAPLVYFNPKIRIGDRHWVFAVPLPERRPNLALHINLLTDPGPPSHLAREEAALIRLLESEAVDYTIISDRDFAYRLPLEGVQLIIFNTHSEYWSEEMLGRLSEAIDRGISVAFLSGNNMYRKVQLLDSAISVIDQMTPADQVVPLIGSYYDASGYLTYDSYRVLDPAHWSFEGAGVQLHSEFGAAGPNHPAASGYETDKLRSGSHQFRVLAVGKNSEGPAFMLCRDLANGGFVFTAGSVAFTPCLDTDAVARRLIRNLIDRALSSQNAQHNSLAQGANASISAR